jgi:PAS domain S-box-containing protein
MQEHIGNHSSIPRHNGLPPFWPIVAIGIVIIATVTRLLLFELLGSRAAFVTFYPAVIIAALYGGLSGGLLATVLSAAAVDFFLLEPRFHLAYDQSADWLSLVIFVLGCVMISFVTEAMRHSKEKLITYQEHLDELVKTRTRELEKQISVREQAEAALQKQAALLDLAYDAIIVSNTAGEITFWNRGAEETYGWSSTEAVGRVVTDLLKTRYPKPEETIKEEAAINGEWDGELVHTRKDGREIVVASRWSLKRDLGGCHTATLEINRDITELKKAQDAAAQLAAIVEHADDAIISKTLDGIIISWNNGAQKMYGYTPEEVIGKQISILIPPGHKDEMPEILQKVRDGEAVRDLETTRKRKDGTLIDVSLTVSPVRSLKGIIVGASTIAHDITGRRMAEEALQHRTEDLIAANRDMESFSYSVSHDLRNPLANISGLTGLLIEDYSGRLDPDGIDYLRHINVAVNKMKTLIADMLNLSRIGRQEMSLTSVDLSAIARSYLQELKSTGAERQADFVIQDKVRANADPRLIHLALENLLRNAWKFTSKKEVARIEFGTIIKDGQTVYFIRDNGVGFDMQFASKIFEPFKRVHTEREFGGSGVGLSIVQRVIGRHGGKVWAESEQNKGATFFFTLAA